MSSEDEEEEKTEPILDDDFSLDKDSDISTRGSALVNTSTILGTSNSNMSNSNTSSVSTNSNIIPVPTPPVVSMSEQPPHQLTTAESLPQQQPKEEKIKLRYESTIVKLLLFLKQY